MCLKADWCCTATRPASNSLTQMVSTALGGGGPVVQWAKAVPAFPALSFARVHAGKEAAVLEAALGIPVLRHREKKPSGGSEDIEQHFE